MRITPTEIALVQDSFNKLKPAAAPMCELFCRRLAEIDPSTSARPRLDAQPDAGSKALVEALTLVVRGLSERAALLEVAKELARAYRRSAVTRREYVSIGCALIWALEQTLREEFTAEVRDAWCCAYEVVAGLMRQRRLEDSSVLSAA